MSRAASFPRIAILLALICALVLILLSRSTSITTVRHARESVLKQDLRTMRMAIENYTSYKHRPPGSLADLVDEKYMPRIPTNPFTRKADWVPHYVQVELDGGHSVIGVDNIHSSAPYSDW